MLTVFKNKVSVIIHTLINVAIKQITFFSNYTYLLPQFQSMLLKVVSVASDTPCSHCSTDCGSKIYTAF